MEAVGERVPGKSSVFGPKTSGVSCTQVSPAVQVLSSPREVVHGKLCPAVATRAACMLHSRQS